LFKEEPHKLLKHWMDEELGGNNQLRYMDGKSWVAYKDWQLWDQAGLFIKQH